MRINLGFVAMSLLLKDASPSKTTTLKVLSNLDMETRRNKLKRLTKENLVNTLRVLTHANAHNIKFYRFTSKLVPFATHDIVQDWDYVAECSEDFDKIGRFVKENAIRVGAHPDHFTVLNSTKEQVVKAAIKDLIYHDNILVGMGLGCEAKLVLHVGGNFGGKDESLKRFKENFELLPKSIKSRIIIENDDKIFNIRDTLNLCQELGLPMVLDFHHHRCNNDGAKLKDYLPAILATWPADEVPKMHISSAKSDKQYRSHANDIDLVDFLWVVDEIKPFGQNLDLMVEAKNKDVAVLNLASEIEKHGGNFRVEREGTIELIHK